MDKYEFNIKVEKMKKAVDRKDYLTAAKVADSIIDERSTNAKVLMMIAQIYEKQERYEDARNALNEVYNRVPVGKRVVYKLIELAIKCGDLEDAQELYQEYQEISPSDPTKLVLAYKIASAKGEPLEKRISILEAYNRRDFEEKWAYELATLYQQAGRDTDCVALCDEIILWFGVGTYVDKAMTLKTTYVPLTPEQEERRAHKEFYEQQLEAMNQEDEEPSAETEEDEAEESEVETADQDSDDESTILSGTGSDFPSDAPSVSPVVKEADLHMTMQQELAQSIQSTSEGLIPDEDTNLWVTDKPISVDRVGEDIDGQYTLFRTVAEENEEARRPDHTRTFSLGDKLTQTRRLDSLRDLAERNAADKVEEAPVVAAEPETAVTAPEVAAEPVTVVTEPETVAAEEVAVAAEPETAVTEEVAATAEPDTIAEDEAVPSEPVADESSDDETDEPETDETAVASLTAAMAEVTETTNESIAEETPVEEDIFILPPHMIFCHVLELNNDEPPLAQIKTAFHEAHRVSGIPAATIARVSVEKINQAGMTAALNKLQGRDLLLEHAGELSELVLKQLISAVDEPPCTAVILLADDAAGVAKLHKKAPSLFPLSFDWLDDEDLFDDDVDAEMEDSEESMSDEASAESHVTSEEEQDVEADSDEDADAEEENNSDDDEDEAFEEDDDFDEDDDSDEDEDSDEDGDFDEDADSDEDGDFDEDDEDEDFDEKDDSDEDEAEVKETEAENRDSDDAQAPDHSRRMTPAEFSSFIHRYALQNDSKFDSMAELALAARIDKMELSGIPLTEQSAIDLVEDAMDKAERLSLRSFFVSRYDKEGYLIIKESHI